jgi:hypothetical protein
LKSKKNKAIGKKTVEEPKPAIVPITSEKNAANQNNISFTKLTLPSYNTESSTISNDDVISTEFLSIPPTEQYFSSESCIAFFTDSGLMF